ncbi:MAG TPA: DNA polymerase III subunit gamma and tau [Dermatophilaceae bacterium]
MSTALYRRYRPESFADVIGQEHVTEPLMQALRTGRVSHAYLFSGPRGCGKTTSARILARCLNCEQGPTPVPCGVCDSCVALARDGSGSVDVIEIDAASHGGVDDARDLRERASYGPAISRYKIYIIDEAHMVTPQGFNALLKIVEEPPEHVKFIFATTQPDKVIGTIRSRTHHYPFRLVPPLRLQDYLGELCAAEGVAVAPGVLSFVVRAGGGSVRDSLSVLDQLMSGSGDEGLTYQGAAALLGFTEGELLDATIDGLAAGDAGAVFRQVDKVIETGADPRRFVEDLLERLRDLIVVAAVPDGASSILRGTPEDQLERIRQQSAAFGPGALSRSADIVNAGLTEMTGATAPRLQLELICARLLLPGASGESGYAARLDRLERRLEMSGAPAPTGPRGQAPVSRVVPEPQPAPTAERPAAERPHAERPAAERPVAERPAAQTVVEPNEFVRPGGTERSGGAEPPGGAERPAAGGRSASGDRPAAGERPPAGERQAAGDRPAAASPVAEPQPVATPAAAPIPGGIDTDAIRRSWPDILAKIFTIRRATWTFLSEHTQVLDYDGTRLLLGIQTEGLTTTFRRGQHAELVRQALSEVLGVEAVVEGIPATQPERSGPPTHAAAPSTTGSSSAAPSTTGSSPAAPSPGASSDAAAPSQTPPPTATTSPADTPSPAVPTPPAQTPRAARSERASTPMQRARAQVAQEVSDRNTSSSPSVADDSMVSADDEDIEEAVAAGQPVIARVLGGTVIGELDQ